MPKLTADSPIDDDDNPLRELKLPESLDDIVLQLGVLAEHYDVRIAHVEADRLLLLALKQTAPASAYADIEQAFNAVRRLYE